MRFVDQTISERNRLIGISKKMILNGEITSSDYREKTMNEFEREKIGLSRIEALYRLNRIEWICEVLEQMERFLSQMT